MSHKTVQSTYTSPCVDVKVSWLYPCQCQCVNSLVRANLTRVFTWDMKVVTTSSTVDSNSILHTDIEPCGLILEADVS